VSITNPTRIAFAREGTFVEGEGVVSMEAEHYARNIPSTAGRWEKIEDYGRTLSAMTILPVTAPSVTPPEKSPCLEYDMALFHSGDVVVHTIIAPTLNFVPGRGLRYAISFDDQPPQVIEIVPEGFDARNGNREWEKTVRDAARDVSSTHKLSRAGPHTLKIRMVDPGVVVQKIILDLGGLRPSYLGPPESYRSMPRASSRNGPAAAHTASGPDGKPDSRME
jgi:hypothetical protein